MISNLPFRYNDLVSCLNDVVSRNRVIVSDINMLIYEVVSRHWELVISLLRIEFFSVITDCLSLLWTGFSFVTE